MSEPWTSLKLIQWTTGHFEKKGIPNPRLDAELLLASVLKCKRVDLYIGFENAVSEKHLAEYKALIERRAKREPLQYILGETEFWGLKFKVTPEVLIPRPETELLVEECLKFVGAQFIAPGPDESGPYILDIGTGSGCIAVSLAKHIPEAKVVATDISKESLEVAKENAEANGVADRIEFVASDIAPWLFFETRGSKFDLIVSNPPYIDPLELDLLQAEVSRHEPRRALDGGKGGLEIVDKILTEAPDFLKSPGRLMLEVGEGQAEALKKKYPCETRKDYGGIERVIILIN
ncbi:MAG TPA: peptide chain release factor N(5)-glutamine methyltransferase [bacterium]|nr:peptide chain release factor N(5)-glutamine methyltransferase [bacterium]